MMEKRVPLTLRLDTGTYTALSVAAHNAGISVNALVGLACRRYMASVPNGMPPTDVAEALMAPHA